ncbi:hypothetical protein M2390_002518 [Mycetocola sp. BIGb0189]|uniref:hypothetical protein n=1 Tax=Mycetocola sp. BIGb0189 TaxID=2940604 RepID=UPI002166C65A|nr:hypothetical protein [Mycetocola sp. BIGb0189]MCS4277314.1 hypothetical protein [Mycetocola sp. BIGb0189]
MLRILVRVTAAGVTLFLAVISALYVMAEEDGFPDGAEYTASVNFTQSPLNKDELVAGLDALASGSGLRLAKVVAGPRDFLSTRSLLIFGPDAPARPQTLNWIRPGVTGQLRSAADLGDTPLDGTLVYSGSTSAVAALDSWLKSSGAIFTVQQRDAGTILGYALLNTGAWLPLLTCLILLVTVSICWYALRARARALKILCGTSKRRILVDDLGSLLRICLLPVIGAALISVALVIGSGRISSLAPFVWALGGLITVSLVAMVIAGLLTSALTWPSIATIASRRPPEGHFATMAEVLKIATLLLVALLLPPVVSAAQESSNFTRQQTSWASLDRYVSLRLGGPSDGDSLPAGLTDLARDADERGSLAFAYAQGAADNETLAANGYDGIVMVNRTYLDAVGPALGFTPGSARPLGAQGEPVSDAQLPTNLSRYLSDSFPLWNRAGRTDAGRETVLPAFRYTGTEPFPGISPVLGELRLLNRPLILVTDSVTSTFTDGFLESTISSGNLIFGDSAWVQAFLRKQPLGSHVRSVDRVSDAGLYSAQQQGMVAQTLTLSALLVLLALLTSVAVSAWIAALTRSRRLFVQRTSGWTWRRILSGRICWEAALAALVTLALVLPRFGDISAVWALLALPLYLAPTLLLHRRAAATTFNSRINRTT